MARPSIGAAAGAPANELASVAVAAEAAVAAGAQLGGTDSRPAELAWPKAAVGVTRWTGISGICVGVIGTLGSRTVGTAGLAGRGTAPGARIGEPGAGAGAAGICIPPAPGVPMPVTWLNVLTSVEAAEFNCPVTGLRNMAAWLTKPWAAPCRLATAAWALATTLLNKPA